MDFESKVRKYFRLILRWAWTRLEGGDLEPILKDIFEIEWAEDEASRLLEILTNDPFNNFFLLLEDGIGKDPALPVCFTEGLMADYV